MSIGVCIFLIYIRMFLVVYLFSPLFIVINHVLFLLNVSAALLSRSSTHLMHCPDLIQPLGG